MSINVLATPAISSLDHYPGQRLGNYYLIELLAQGGSGSIYLARHQYLKTLAAVKVLHTYLDGDDLRQFREEARIIAAFNHAHIVRVLDFNVEKGAPFLVMEYAPYGTLRKRYREGVAYSPSTILEHVLQVSSALHYIHQQGFIHRDIKPDNMLLGRNHKLLLGDFGISMLALPGNVLTAVSRVGTVSYMAPEQIVGKACAASDQYALGVTMYEWLSGTSLFRGTTREIASQHLHEQPGLLHDHVRGIAPAVEQVVLRALAKKPEERFGSVEEFANEFKRATEDNGIYTIVVERHEGNSLPTTGQTNIPSSVPMLQVDRKQALLKEGFSLFSRDLLLGAIVLGTLYGLHLPLLSFELLLWLTLLTAPMIYTWSRPAWSGRIFTVSCFAASALAGLLLQEFVALVFLYSFGLFVGGYIQVCLKIRSEQGGK